MKTRYELIILRDILIQKDQSWTSEQSAFPDEHANYNRSKSQVWRLRFGKRSHSSGDFALCKSETAPLKDWLRNQVAPTYDAMLADPRAYSGKVRL